MSEPKTVQVYLPVCVTLVDGKPAGVAIDFDGAPWMYSGTAEGNAYDPDLDENGWRDPEDAELKTAEDYVSALFITGDPQP
jgi:hypothetical protein